MDTVVTERPEVSLETAGPRSALLRLGQAEGRLSRAEARTLRDALDAWLREDGGW